MRSGPLRRVGLGFGEIAVEIYVSCGLDEAEADVASAFPAGGKLFSFDSKNFMGQPVLPVLCDVDSGRWYLVTGFEQFTWHTLAHV